MANTLSTMIIARDAQDTIANAIESVSKYTDEFIIGVDDRTKDSTYEVVEQALRKRNNPRDKLYRFSWPRSGFAGVRNLAASFSTCRWIFVLDADEELFAPNAKTLQRWRQRLDRDEFPWADAFQVVVVRESDVNRIKWLIKSGRQIDPIFYHIHVRGYRPGRGYSYWGAMHESVIPEDSFPPHVPTREPIPRFDVPTVQFSRLYILSTRPGGQSKERQAQYLAHFLREIREAPYDGRAWWYIANALKAFRAPRKDIINSLICAANGAQKEGNFDQASRAWADICHEYALDGNWQEVTKAALRSIYLFPRRREPYVYLGIAAFEEHRYLDAIHWYNLALQVPPPSDTNLAILGEFYTWRPLASLGLCYLALFDWDIPTPEFEKASRLKALKQAKKYLEAALKYDPPEPEVKRQYKRCKELLRRLGK